MIGSVKKTLNCIHRISHFSSTSRTVILNVKYVSIMKNCSIYLSATDKMYLCLQEPYCIRRISHFFKHFQVHLKSLTTSTIPYCIVNSNCIVTARCLASGFHCIAVQTKSYAWLYNLVQILQTALLYGHEICRDLDQTHILTACVLVFVCRRVT